MKPLGRHCVYDRTDVLYGECEACRHDEICSFEAMVGMAMHAINVRGFVASDLPIMIRQHNVKFGTELTEEQVRRAASLRLEARSSRWMRRKTG